MKNIIIQRMNIASWICLLLFVLAACSPTAPATLPPTALPSATTIAKPMSRAAQVQSVEIEIMNATSMEVNAVVHGILTESCTTLGESQVEYASNTFRITSFVYSPADQGCVQITRPFETTIPLSTNNLPAGTYTVIVNGLSTVFTAPVENATPTSSRVPTAAATSRACVDGATFVTDVTIPDNMVIAPNTPFTKTWRIKNTGSCTWDSRYLVSYISGATMSQQPGYWIVPQGQTVMPGETVDISVGMASPPENGSYQSYWGLKKENGTLTPIQGGANGDSFYVRIKVNNGITPGNVTAASIDIELEQGSGPACIADSTYFVQASITTSGATTVAYEIDSTAGQTPAGYFQTSNGGDSSLSIPGSFVFDQADTKTIDLRFVGPYPYPDNITMLLWVNRSEWYQTRLSCQ